MIRNFIFLIICVLAVKSAWCQPVSKGPYTVYVINEGIYHIEDANESNPAGNHISADGKSTGMNNCSDMYLVVGDDKALLIDLSNAIKWDSTATESLRTLVYERTGNRQLYITVTHKHGDHLGMLPAFKDDDKAFFWIPRAEFEGMDIFPDTRTSFFDKNASFDLGAEMVINTMEVPGHTDHSTLFFVKDKNMVFSGDAIGSGSGVWLFDYESFIKYIAGIEELINYIENPANKINRSELIIYGGHAWQKGSMEKLTSQYIYDMRELIDKIGKGAAGSSPMAATRGFLDTNFTFGTATITWNKEAAAKYAALNKD